MTPEGRVKGHVRKWLKEHDIWYFQPVSNGMGVSGIPDFICCWQGQFFAIETKAPGKTRGTTANQDRVIGEIRDHRGWAVVVDDVVLLDELFEGLKHAKVEQGQAGLPEGVQRAAGEHRQAGEEQRRAA